MGREYSIDFQGMEQQRRDESGKSRKIQRELRDPPKSKQNYSSNRRRARGLILASVSTRNFRNGNFLVNIFNTI